MTLAAAMLVYPAVSYWIAPVLWKTYARRHASFDDNPRITSTGSGHPGDPLNVGLIGSETEVREVMQAAQWISGSM